jgi:type IX secretion system PorP/SprF family membrane protein
VGANPTKQSVTCLFVLCTIGVLRGQEPQITQFAEVQSAFNPGVTGLYDGLDVTALYRTQWVGLNGHPVTQVLTATVPVYPWKSGIGLTITNDVAGAQRVTAARLSFAHHLTVNTRTRFAIGLSAGGFQHALDGLKLRAPEGDYTDGGVDHNDPAIPSTSVSAIVPDLAAGVVLSTSLWYAGLGVSHLIEPASNLEVAGVGSTDVTFSRTYFAHAGAAFRIAPDWSLCPSLQLKTDLALYQIEVQSRVVFRDNIWAGLAFRGFSSASKDALAGMVGMNITSSLRGGYAYDLSLSGLNRANNGSHELFLNYRLPIPRPSAGKIINNPRYISS